MAPGSGRGIVKMPSRPEPGTDAMRSFSSTVHSSPFLQSPSPGFSTMVKLSLSLILPVQCPARSASEQAEITIRLATAHTIRFFLRED